MNLDTCRRNLFTGFKIEITQFVIIFYSIVQCLQRKLMYFLYRSNSFVFFEFVLIKGGINKIRYERAIDTFVSKINFK